jgi:hypothetical protein
MIYGPSFENKKGFIIDGTIVLNHDRVLLQCFMNLDIIMLGGFLNPGAHAALMENVQNTYKCIPWYSAMYHRLKETDVVEEVFVDQLGLAAAKNLEKLWESILRMVPGLLTIYRRLLKKLTKTGHWTGYLLGSLFLL